MLFIRKTTRIFVMDIKKALINEWFFLVFLVAYIALIIYNPSFLNPDLIDTKTVLILAALIISNTGIFVSGGTDYIAGRILRRFRNLKSVSIVAIILTVFISMFITNDASLIILVPLTISIGRMAGKSISRTVVLEAIGANVGSTLTPFGNPQNIILFRAYHLNLPAFFSTSLPLFAILMAILLVFALVFTKNSKISGWRGSLKYKPSLFYASFALFVLTVSGFLLNLSGYFFLAVSVASIFALLFMKPKSYTARRALFRIDFLLILTFALIFLVMNSIKSMVSVSLLGILPAFVLPALISQVISNVPTTVLLTGKASFMPLFWGVNIGGNGTIIASLANWIALRRLPTNGIKEFMKISGLFLLITFIIGLAVFL